MKRLFIAGMIFILFLSLGAVSSSAAGSFTSKTYNGRTYKLYVPSSYQRGAALPLVVMLHGCTQDPDQFAAGTQMNELAETEKFLVLIQNNLLLLIQISVGTGLIRLINPGEAVNQR